MAPTEIGIAVFQGRGVTLIDDAVYLLEEVWQLVSTSGQDTALGMVDFINRRLAHKSPIVKQKVRAASTGNPFLISMSSTLGSNSEYFFTYCMSPTFLQTLRLIKFLCGKGASDFKRGISKQAGTVR